MDSVDRQRMVVCLLELQVSLEGGGHGRGGGGEKTKKENKYQQVERSKFPNSFCLGDRWQQRVSEK